MKSKYFLWSITTLLLAGCAVGAREIPDGSASNDVTTAVERGAAPRASESGVPDADDAPGDGPGTPDALATPDAPLPDTFTPDAPCPIKCAGRCPGAPDGCGGTCKTNGCSGCCDGSQCRMGTFDTACGKAGQACADCTGKVGGECGKGACKAGACSGTFKPDGTVCKGGFCRKGACCKGCWDGKACYPGASPKLCSAGGGKCALCWDGKVCTADQCVSGKCAYLSLSSGSPCPGPGTCRSGACCGGCWLGAQCLAGKAPTTCGSGGAACKPCVSSDPCRTASCASGTCKMTNKSNLMPCPGGTCVSGACCADCGSIVLAALNEAHDGALGGVAGADKLCAGQAAAAGQKGQWKAFLSGGGRNVIDLVKPCCRSLFGVFNTKSQLLYSSWSQIFGSKTWLNNLFLHSFDGKKVDEGTGAVPDWADADGWHGSLQNGLVDVAHTCNNWTNGADTIRGGNGELDFGELMKQEKATCNKTLAVVCVRVAP